MHFDDYKKVKITMCCVVKIGFMTQLQDDWWSGMTHFDMK